MVGARSPRPIIIGLKFGRENPAPTNLASFNFAKSNLDISIKYNNRK